MPTFIGHTAAGIALGTTVIHKQHCLRAAILSIFCSVAPDFDSIGFRLGIPYHHWLGHRGFSHSILFAVILALIATLFIIGIEKSTKMRFLYFCVFFACGLSHDNLDAMTNGGLGVAFFSPLSEQRFFLSWRPIDVSPLSLKQFLTSRGIKVLKSEFTWVILPSLCFAASMPFFRIIKKYCKT